MALTDTDLRDVLAQRASAMPADISLARVAAVGHRVRVIRRRRAASASLAVVIVLLVATGVSGLFREPHDRTSPVPAYQQKVAGGLLPRYNGGGEATAYTSFSTDVKRETTFTFTPSSLAFRVAVACDKAMPSAYLVSFEINGHPLMSGSCGASVSTAGTTAREEQGRADELGVRVGEQSTVRVHVVRGRTSTPETLPVYRGAMADYRIGVATYSPIPIADYPFPPRPRKLASLDQGALAGDGQLLGTVDSRTVGPAGPGAVPTTLTSKGLHVDTNAVAPGTLTMTVDGKTVDTASSWTWTSEASGGEHLTARTLRRLGVDVKVGDRITVRVTGSRFTDPAWRAQVREGS